MDVNAYVQSMVDANVNIILINVGGIVANYPTLLPYQFRNTFIKGDLVGDLVNGLHDKGIRVIGRFDFSKINKTLAAQKPDWLYVSATGQHVNTSTTTARSIPASTEDTNRNTPWKYSKKPYQPTPSTASSST